LGFSGGSHAKRLVPRELGRHYTPAQLSRRIVLSGLSASAASLHSEPLRILDPACGDGALLLATFEELCAQRITRDGHDACGELTSADRLKIFRSQLFGCDIDPHAVASLRSALRERIGATGDLADTAAQAVEENIRIGDALLGPGPERNDLLFSANADAAIDWIRDFPAAREAGGFDLIIGNPPYVREKDCRALFERIASTPFGRRWREARMDLWYYFAHRALDLLRSGGILTFVVNSYWTASRGASKLIDRFEREAILEEIELLGTQKLFAGVAGRHLIFRLRKRHDGPHGNVNHDGAHRNLPSECRVIPTAAPAYRMRQCDLYQGGRLTLVPPVTLDLAAGRTTPLSEAFETRQGMAENPPSINRRLLRSTNGDFVLGEGVFVLQPSEVERLKLSDAERTLLRPYYDTSVIERHSLPKEPTHQVLYLTKKTAPTLKPYPAIQSHLSRFRAILERRRETQTGSCAWWHLHWPREESIFVAPRILSVQMGKRPRFVAVQQPTFVGFSVNLIVNRANSGISLPALAGILNSSLALEWFERHAKRRGVHLEINAHVLRQFPLPPPDLAFDGEVTQLVEKRQNSPAGGAEAEMLERRIEAAVARWYGVPSATSADGKTSSTL
jgi:hypothetical protein